MKRILSVVLAVAVFGGCATSSSTPPAASDSLLTTLGTAPAKAQAPLKVGIYADRGPGGIGAMEWFRLVNESPEMELKLLNGKMVREGGLDGLDVFVMPGGSSKTEFDTLGTNGVKKMIAFVRNGGGYIGTCAGCCLLMDGPNKRARMMPYDTSGSEPNTMFPTFNLNAKGAAALGLKEGSHVMRYHGGPFLWPTTNKIADAKLDIWGTYDAEASFKGRVNTKKRMYGAAGIVGGTYGKGKVFVTSGHPEYFNSTIYVVEAAFKFVTGRDIKFPVRKRTPRALAVGFLAGYGVDMAQTALDIDAEPDMDLVLIDLDGIKQRRLDHLDVLVVCGDKLAKNDFVKKSLADFVARGGKMVGIKDGVNLLPAGGVKSKPGAETVKAIRGLFPTR